MPNRMRIRGAVELKRKINRIVEGRAARNGLLEAAIEVKGLIAEYPVQIPGRPQRFVSEKQRRYVMAAIRKGKIVIPYRRGQAAKSERHGQSWTVVQDLAALRVSIGSDTSYGPYLQDPVRQTAFHRAGNWKMTKAVIDGPAPGILERALKRNVDRDLERA